LPGEGDLAGGRGTNRARVAERDVDASVLPACVRVVDDGELT